MTRSYVCAFVPPLVNIIRGGVRQRCLRPLGFSLGEKDIKRAGLDHWEHVDLTVHDDW